MGKWKTWVAGERVTLEQLNELLDFRVYATKGLADDAFLGAGETEKFRMCAVVDEGKYYYWNGTSLVVFPSAGGSGAPVDATYVTINAEGGLSAEVQHGNITTEAHKHAPKLHKDSHVTGGGDAFLVSDLLDAIARSSIRKNSGGSVYSRRRVNFIEGTNISLDVADDPSNEEVDVTITAAGGNGGTYKLPFAQTVWRSGSTYYRMDSDGTQYSSSNPLTILQAAENAADDVAGVVFVKAHASGYPCASSDLPISVSSGVDFIGEGYGSRIYRTGSAGNAIFEMNGYDSSIQRLLLDGNGTDGNAVIFKSSGAGMLTFMRDCWVTACNAPAILIQAWWTLIKNSWVCWNNDDGIVVDISSGYYAVLTDCLLKGNSGHNFRQIRNDSYGPTVLHRVLMEFAGYTGNGYNNKWGAYIEKHPVHFNDCATENNRSSYEQGIYLGSSSTRSKDSKIVDCAGMGNITVNYATGTILDNVTLRGGCNVTVSSNAVRTRCNNVYRYSTQPDCISDTGAQTVINGCGKEAAGSGQPPTTADWRKGDMVHNTSDNTIWLKCPDGTFRKLQ